MITVQESTSRDFTTIQKIASLTWPQTFGHILSGEQITYMLNMMYSTAALTEQVKNGHIFLLAKKETECLGYASYEVNYKNTLKTKIHKIYILPTAQGAGIGRSIIEHIISIAKKKGSKAISLNVNRNNQAIQFYEKMGFINVGEETIPIGQGFLMEDLIYDKKI